MQYIYHFQTSDTVKYNFEKLLEQEDKYFCWADERLSTQMYGHNKCHNQLDIHDRLHALIEWRCCGNISRHGTAARVNS